MKLLKSCLIYIAVFSFMIGALSPMSIDAKEIVADPVEIFDARLNTHSLVVAFGQVIIRRDDLENGKIIEKQTTDWSIFQK